MLDMTQCIIGFEPGAAPSPEETYAAQVMVKTVDVVNSDLWRAFPTINVDRTEDIPCDYPGMMGVPITFMDKFNAAQFEIMGISNHHRLVNGRAPYRRIFIRNLHPQLPEEIDLNDWMRRCGVPATFEFVPELPQGAIPVYRSRNARTKEEEPNDA